jgi:signal transduction histidine kinase
VQKPVKPLQIFDIKKYALMPEWIRKVLGEFENSEELNSLRICTSSQETQNEINNGFWVLQLVGKESDAVRMPVIFADKNGLYTQFAIQFSTLLSEKFSQNISYTDELLQQTLLELHSKNEAVKKANEEIDKFVYSASHDLRAPLTSVLGLVYLLKQKDTSSEHQLYFDLMIESIGRLDSTIRDIVAYSKNNKTDIRIEPINLTRLLEPVIVQLSNIEAHHFNLFECVSILSDQLFYSDWSRLQIVLYNLMINSIKYRSNERPLSIVVALETNNDQVVITFSDNGSGIESKYLDKIFDMFYRSNEKSLGAGLGLYIVKEIIDRLGGEITVHSALNVGTTFKIKLPNHKQN